MTKITFADSAENVILGISRDCDISICKYRMRDRNNIIHKYSNMLNISCDTLSLLFRSDIKLNPNIRLLVNPSYYAVIDEIDAMENKYNNLSKTLSQTVNDSFLKLNKRTESITNILISLITDVSNITLNLEKDND